MSSGEQNLISDVVIKYTEKKYYNKYVYKLVLEADISDIGPRQNNNYYWRKAVGGFQVRVRAVSLLNKIKEVAVDDIDNKFRIEYNRVSYFTNSVEVIDMLLTTFRGEVQTLYQPYNENHTNVITDNKRVRVRARLFEDKFRYKIYFKYRWGDRERRFPEIREWLDTLDNKGSRWMPNKILTRFLETDKEHRALGYTIAVYLNDPEDVFICQMKFQGLLDYIEEAILVSEL